MRPPMLASRQFEANITWEVGLGFGLSIRLGHGGLRGAQIARLEAQKAALAAQRGLSREQRGPGSADPDIRRLNNAITVRARPVAADEEEVAALAANEARYLGLAREHYRRCARAAPYPNPSTLSPACASSRAFWR